MDVSLKRRKLFYNNLLLLGLDKVALEKKYRVSFDRDMFCVPNKKGFEVVTFFLFSKLDEVAEQNYRIVWPLYNKETERQFQKTCLNYFSEIAKVSRVRFPRIVNSLLSTFSGDRFYKLYLAFSSHVLERTLERNMTVNSRPVVSRQNYAIGKEILKVSTIGCVARTKEVHIASSNHLEVWLKCAKDFYECFQKLSNETATLISLCKERKENIIFACCEKVGCSRSLSLDGAFEICISYNKKVKQQWQKLKQFISNESKLWSCLRSELQDDEEKYVLDGAKSRLVVPEVIYKQCDFQLRECDFQSSDVNGKLCIERFLKLFSLYLDFFTCMLNKVDLSHLHEFSSVPSASGLEENTNKLVVKMQWSQLLVPEFFRYGLSLSA
ncbi:HAUS augmin-like complex subunit 6 isoform X2 [Stegodyphus dumicola]|uniref:HAUS augmin-like complex subunit 6 isoform X2 n=1 Tax=Stegodyphus dumicola TaxID=202533 RepID=UPI0015A95823|nr:HAUS augmin-like complex subunit 6 isoform X2 [Stegodyphus dumicola]